MINITSDNSCPSSISGAQWGAEALPHVVGNTVVVTSDVEIVMKKKSFNAQMPPQWLK